MGTPYIWFGDGIFLMWTVAPARLGIVQGCTSILVKWRKLSVTKCLKQSIRRCLSEFIQQKDKSINIKVFTATLTWEAQKWSEWSRHPKVIEDTTMELLRHFGGSVRSMRSLAGYTARGHANQQNNILWRGNSRLPTGYYMLIWLPVGSIVPSFFVRCSNVKFMFERLGGKKNARVWKKCLGKSAP